MDVNCYELATKLYDMVSDMDANDYAENKERELNRLETELLLVKELGCKSLLNAICMVAEQ